MVAIAPDMDALPRRKCGSVTPIQQNTHEYNRLQYYDLEGRLFYTISPVPHAAVRQLADFLADARGVVAQSTCSVVHGVPTLLPAPVPL